jgi:hypothetical protein
VKNNRKHNNQTTARQGAEEACAEPLKIGASTPFDFSAHNLTAYGGLLPVATMLHHLRFLEREPMLTGILKVLRLPPQCTFWRFLA